MNNREIIYSELENLILSLGFSPIKTTGNHKIFQHSSGALIVLPDYQKKSRLNQIHLIAVRRILKEYGLMNEYDFNNYFNKISHRVVI